MKTRRSILAAAAVAVSTAAILLPATPALAYNPAGGVLYQLGNEPCLKGRGNCAIYPKATQLPSGRLIAAFEQATVPASGSAIGETVPVYKSDDNGTTWQPLADVQAPAYMSSDPQYAKYTSNWTNPYFYVLQHDIGDLTAGTLVLATVVSGDDHWYTEHKAADPNWVPDGDGDRSDLAIALYASTDDGASWNFQNIVATGGWQGGSAGNFGRFSAANTAHEIDPVWEPYVMEHDGKLVVYYSDENDYTGYDPTTGVATLDPNNDTAPDSGGQILAHRTWDGASSGWSAPIIDVSGLTQDMGGGKTEIGGGRPGMANVVPTTDGKWMITFEYFGGGANVHFKMATDPLKFYADGTPAGDEISHGDGSQGALPYAPGSQGLSWGGSPVVISLPDGRLVYNAAGNGDVWVNQSGRSDGVWTQYQTNQGAGYSRNLTYVAGTGRVLILHNEGTSVLRYGEVDLGNSEGTYYQIVNRKTGQVIGTGNHTNDDRFNNYTPATALEAAGSAANADTQLWHIVARPGGNVTLLNKSGGRAAELWGPGAAAGQRIGQWVDDVPAGIWKLQSTGDGYYHFVVAANTTLQLSGTSNGAPLTVQTAATDGSQDWQLVPVAPTAADLTSSTRNDALITATSAEPGTTVALNAAASDPSGAPLHANVTGHAYAVNGTGGVTDLGSVTFDGNSSGSVTLPSGLTAGQNVQIAVQFDESPLMWDQLAITAPSNAVSHAVSTAAGSSGSWYGGTATVTLTAASKPGRTIQYQVDSAAWKTYARPFTIGTAGAHTVTTRQVEGGNTVDSSTSSFSVNIDKTAPTVSSSVSPAATGTPRNPVTVSFGATDAASGVASTSYQVDGGAWTTASGPVTIAEVGTHTIGYRAVDNVGNTSAVRTTKVTINADPATNLATAKTAKAGGYATYTVTGFHRYSWVTITLGSTTLTTVFTSVNGVAKVTVQIPAGTAAGSYTVTASDGSATATATQKVAA